MKKVMRRVVVSLFIFMMTLGLVPGLTLDVNAEASVLTTQYNANMAFDCSRYPAVPEKGRNLIVGLLDKPYKCANQIPQDRTDLGTTYLKVESLGTYKTQSDDIKYALINGGTQKIALLADIPADERDNVPIFKLVQYDANGNNLGDFTDPGCLYILDVDADTFIFCGCGYNTDKSYGYFLSGSAITQEGYHNTFPGDKVGGLVETDRDLNPRSTLVTDPVAKTGLAENGNPQELVTGGSAENGTMQYVVSNDPSAAPRKGWSASIPTGTKAGTYYVWYKVVGDADHSDTNPKGPLTVTIAATYYTITYDLDGGMLDGQTGSVSRKYNIGTIIDLPAPTKDGYTFDYWEGSRYNAGDKYTVNSDHTFKAVWKVAETASKDNDTKKKSASKKGVKTGDENDLALWIILMSASLAGVAGMALVSYRRK